MLSGGGGSLSILTGSSNKFLIDSNGVVGIGTTIITNRSLNIYGETVIIPNTTNGNTGYINITDSSASAGSNYNLMIRGLSNNGSITSPLGIIDLFTNSVKINGNSIYAWVEITPVYTEFEALGVPNNANRTFTINGATASTRAVLADVFLRASFSDAQNISFGRGYQTSYNWVGGYTRPSTVFTTNPPSTNQLTTISYSGETDNYTTFYGTWYSSLIIPTIGTTCYYSSAGNSGSTMWVYIIVRAISN